MGIVLNSKKNDKQGNWPSGRQNKMYGMPENEIKKLANYLIIKLSN